MTRRGSDRRQRADRPVNRVRAAGEIAPLLSWRSLRSVPVVFRIAFVFIGAWVIVLIGVLVFAPLIVAWFG